MPYQSLKYRTSYYIEYSTENKNKEIGTMNTKNYSVVQ